MDHLWDIDDNNDELLPDLFDSSKSGNKDSKNNNNINDDNDDDDYDEENVTIPGAQHILILLDCSTILSSDDMMKFINPDYPDDDPIHMIDWCICVILKFIKTKIRIVTIQKTGKRDGIGIILYNTKRRLPLQVLQQQQQQQQNEHNNNNNFDYSNSQKNDNDDLESDDDDDEMYQNGTLSTQQTSTVHDLLPLAPPGVNTVEILKKTKLDDPFQDTPEINLIKEFCYTDENNDNNNNDPLSIQEALMHAMQTFRTASCVKQRPSKPNESHDTKQIWILTCNDNPTTIEMKQLIQSTFIDVRDNGYDVIVWPLTSSFDINKFYNTIPAKVIISSSFVNNDSNEDNDDEEQEHLSIQLMDTLLMYWERHYKKTRRAYSVPLLWPNNIQQEDNNIMLDFYKLTQTAREPTKVPIHQTTGKRLEKMTQLVMPHGEILSQYNKGSTIAKANNNEDTNNNKKRFRTYYEFGGERVYITEDERIEIKRQGNTNKDFASLIIWGFKPISSIPFYHRIEHTYFCYPNENDCTGSSSAFAYLHDAMIRKNVIAIGELLVRVTARSRLVSIRPLSEEIDDDNNTCKPAGMLVSSIPYEDELRIIEKDLADTKFDEDGVNIATPELLDITDNIVRKRTLINMEFGEDFQNPYLSRLWEYVEHIAYGEYIKKEDIYDTEINENDVLEHIGIEIEQFNAALPEDIIVPKKESKKRPLVPDNSGINWKEVYEEGLLDKCKVIDLKSKLKSLGEPVSNKNKAALIEVLIPHLQSEYNDLTSEVEKPIIKNENNDMII